MLENIVQVFCQHEITGHRSHMTLHKTFYVVILRIDRRELQSVVIQTGIVTGKVIAICFQSEKRIQSLCCDRIQFRPQYLWT